MRVLVIGSGAREHALVLALRRDPAVEAVAAAPGNAGMAAVADTYDVDITSGEAVAGLARRIGADLVVIGPEVPLVLGVADAVRAAGIACFGPTRQAARIEGSKSFAKDVMQAAGVRTAANEVVDNPGHLDAALDRFGPPVGDPAWVVKDDGLAAGKGVVVAATLEEAHAAVDAMLGDGKLGQAGARVVIEEYLEGEEASFIVLCDGKHVLPLATSQDHKRLKDNDEGPNTGGMGAYSPAPVVTPELHGRIMREVIWPTVHGMAKDGIPYTGFLYAGLMIGPHGVRVLEFNCRMGDPETQPIMMRVKNDLLEVFENAVSGTLDQANVDWDRRTALGVVMAAANYPDTPRTGDVITGLPPEAEDCMVFHAGTVESDGVVKTSGGRVLCVTVLGDSVKLAQQRAYDVLQSIHFDGAQYRRDIGWRAIARRAAATDSGTA